MKKIDTLITQLSPGDHVFTWGDTQGGNYSPIVHHGIYIENGEVVHYLGGKKKEAKLPITKTHLSKFLGSEDAGLGIIEYSQCFPPDVVVLKAMDRLDEQDYQLVTNNCEHFAFSCKSENMVSYQVLTGGIIAIGILGILLGKRWGGLIFHAPGMVNDMLLIAHGMRIRIIQDNKAPRIGFFSEWKGYIGQPKLSSKSPFFAYRQTPII